MWGCFLRLLSWMGWSPIPFIASMVGTTEPAINLLLSIFMAYPLALIYHRFVKIQYYGEKAMTFRNMYFVLTGIDMAIYNFGLSLYHNLIPPIIFYITTMLLKAGKENVIVTFSFNMGYLLTGYLLTESEDYDITWTMPHCVLTLKLIALSFDLWDGHKMLNGEELSTNNKKTALDEPPTLIELLGYVYFPACFLVGPIFSFRRYKEFVSGKYPLEATLNNDCYVTQASYKLVQGVAYLIAFQVGVSVFSMQYMMSDEFYEKSIFYRHIFCGMWAHFALYKYISCWLLTEASCIRFGLSYNGTKKTSDGRTELRWDGCNNIKLVRFETATKFQHYIESFNCNTNYFAAEYIYKRLKFIGNKNISQFVTLIFLALWHGTRSGYYVTFLNEFLIILMERELESILQKYEIYHKLWSNGIVKYGLYALLKMYTIVFMGWSLVPFDVKVYPKWISIYSSLYFSGFILFAPWALVYKPSLIKAVKSLNLVKTE